MMGRIISIVVVALVPIVFAGSPLHAAKGDPEKGREIYMKRCWWCHGEEGAADGPAAEFMLPPPRDFTEGVYKFKSTPFDELIPSDEDFFNMIKGGLMKEHVAGWNGMNNTSMPGWEDMLKDDEIWHLVAYIKSIVEYEQPEQGPISVGNKVASSEDSIEKGRKIFREMCAECHGEEGRGDGTKMLKDDWGYRTWPRNLTKPWTFRMTDTVEDIYTRITVGIPGTQMPSFADPESKKRLNDEERWHVANYVVSIAAPYKKPDENTVIKALRIEEEVPDNPSSPVWEKAEYTSFWLVPQMIAKERHFKPSLDSVSVKVVYNDKEIAFLLEWDDRTKSVPGDAKAEEIAAGEVFRDGVAIQLPVVVPEGSEKPYFAMGDKAKPVSVWFWQSETTTEPQRLKLLEGKGFDKIEERDPSAIGLTARGVYDHGTWRVVMKRPLLTKEKDKDIQFVEGKFIPVAFAAWDGSNGEKGSKHELTTWYWLLLKPPVGASIYIVPIAVAVVVLVGELLLLRRFRKD